MERARPASSRGLTADGVVDELLPEGLDWRALVRRYPLPALALAALGGYLLGRSRGRQIAEGVSTWAADAVTDSVGGLLDRDLP